MRTSWHSEMTGFCYWCHISLCLLNKLVLVTRKGGKLMSLVSPCKRWNKFTKCTWQCPVKGPESNVTCQLSPSSFEDRGWCPRQPPRLAGTRVAQLPQLMSALGVLWPLNNENYSGGCDRLAVKSEDDFAGLRGIRVRFPDAPEHPNGETQLLHLV